MKWFHILRHGNRITGGLAVSEGDLIGYEDWDVAQGKHITTWQVPTFMGNDPDMDGPPDDVLHSHMQAPVLSPRLQKALTAAGVKDIQYLPVHIVRGSGGVEEGFAIANILTLRQALHRGKSKFKLWPEDYDIPARRGQIRAIYTFVLIGEAMTGCDLIRLEEYDVAMFCSERVKRVFDENGFTGWGFNPVEVVYSSH